MKVQIRDFTTGEVVRSFDCDCPEDSRRHERMLGGLLANMDTDRYYVFVAEESA